MLCPPLPHRGRGDVLLTGTGTSPIITAMLPPSPPQAPEFLARPAGSARQRFAHIHRDCEPCRFSEIRCHCVIPVCSSSCPCFQVHSAAARVPALVQRRRCSHAAARGTTVHDAAGRRSTGRFRQLRTERLIRIRRSGAICVDHPG